MKRAGVIGSPISHSLSPVVHGYWLEHYGIEGSYEALEIPPEALEDQLKALPEEGFIGLNLTVPHKILALEWITDVDSKAREIGAINTLVWRGDHWQGSNTDHYGFIQHLYASVPAYRTSEKKPALVLGGGGAARGVCSALLDAGVSEIRLCNRTAEKAQALAKDYGRRVRTIYWENRTEAQEGIGLLVNTTTLGMRGQPPLGMPLDSLARDVIVYDIVYHPLETPLLAEARCRGNPVVDGLGMLLWQAQPGFSAWFGVTPEITPALRQRVLKTIV